MNLEYLARRRVRTTKDGVLAYPDTLVGTIRTTMVNGLGVVGWGVGGIEASGDARPADLDADSPVLRVRLTGTMLEGATATDLVLTITERLPSMASSASSWSSTVPGSST